MAFGRMPNILDQGFLDNMPNVLPAGEAPWMRGQPTQVLPEAGQVRPEWNSVWLKPGMLLEPGTGFANQGANAAIMSQFQLPAFGFGINFPGFGPGGFGYSPPPPPAAYPPEGGQGPAASEDYLGQIIKVGANLARNLSSGGGTTSTFFGPEATEKGMQNEWGFPPEPKPDLGMGPTTFDTGEAGLTLTPEYTGVQGLSDLTGLPPSSAVQQFYNFPNEPVYSLTNVGPGAENLPTLDPSKFDLGVNPTLNANPDILNATNILNLGAIAIPAVTSLVTKNKEANLAAGLTGAGLSGTAAGLSIAGAGAAGAGMAGAGIVTAPLVATYLIAQYLRATNRWGHANTPDGFFAIPNKPGYYANPTTGVIIQNEGRFNFVPSEQSKAGQPITPEQAKEWGMPIPGVNIGFNDLNPFVRARIQNLMRMRERGGFGDVNNGRYLGTNEQGNPEYSNADVDIELVKEALNPGQSSWTPRIEELQNTYPTLSPGEIWRLYSISPEGQALLAEQQRALEAMRGEYSGGGGEGGTAEVGGGGG